MILKIIIFPSSIQIIMDDAWCIFQFSCCFEILFLSSPFNIIWILFSPGSSLLRAQGRTVPDSFRDSYDPHSFFHSDLCKYLKERQIVQTEAPLYQVWERRI